MSCLQFPQKRPGEQLGLTFDFSALLPGTATITGIAGTPAVTVNSGADPAPASILGNPASIAMGGKAVIVPVVGGVPACSYIITVTVNTDLGRFELPGLLPIAPALADCL